MTKDFIVEAIKEHADTFHTNGIEALWLGGSFATGRNHSQSDLDLHFVINQNFKQQQKNTIRELLTNTFGRSLDIVSQHNGHKWIYWWLMNWGVKIISNQPNPITPKGNQIVQILKDNADYFTSQNLLSMYLCGSFALGTEHTNSDIDINTITNEHFTPQNMININKRFEQILPARADWYSNHNSPEYFYPPLLKYGIKTLNPPTLPISKHD